MAHEEREYSDQPDRPRGPAVTSGKAVTALVCGLLSFFCPVLIPNVLAIVFGILGLADVKKGRPRVKGQGLAIAGLILGTISLVMIPIVAILIGLLLPAVSKVREAAAKVNDQNKLKMIALSFHTYHDRHKGLPPAAVYSKEGRPLYSWRVLMLPDLEGDNLYKRFHLDEPWDSPHNVQFVKQIPPIYVSGLATEEEEKQGLTPFQVFVSDGSDPGPRPIFLFKSNPNPQDLVPYGPDIPNVFILKNGRTQFRQIKDGLSNTIFVAQAAAPVPWTKPADLVYSSRGPLPRLATYGTIALVSLGDSSARRIEINRVSEKTLRNAITMDDNQILGPDW